VLPVFVISLESESARRNMIAAHLAERGLDFSFFNAVDGRAMDVLAHPDYDSTRRRRAHGRDLKPGELGCLLSHRAVYQHIVDQGLPFALILEDDARLASETQSVLEALLAKNIPFDLIRLLGSPKVARKTHRKILKLYGDFWLVRLLTTPGGAHATLVSQEGARKLLKHLARFAFPIDTILGRTWETGLNVYSVQPGLAVQDLSFESSIGEDRFDKAIALKGLHHTQFKLTRAIFKISEMIGKRWVFYKNLWNDKVLHDKSLAKTSAFH